MKVKLHFYLSDTQTCPSLWVGTSLGSVIQVTISATAMSAEARATTPIVVSPSGKYSKNFII